MKESLLSRLGFAFERIQNNWLPVAGSTSEIPEFRQLSQRTMFLCAGRTGSEYLSYLLEDFGLVVREYFNIEQYVAAGLTPPRFGSWPESEGHAPPPPKTNWSGLFGKWRMFKRPPIGPFSTVRDYVIEIVSTASNGRLGIKGGAGQTIPLLLYDEWPKYSAEWKVVCVRRRNVVLQAISLLLAQESGAWNAAMTPAKQFTSADYDFAEIAQSVEAIVLSNNHIERLVSYLSLDALTVYYEDLKANPRQVADAVGHHLGLERISTDALEGRGTSRSKPRIQGTQLNLEWEERFRRDIQSWNLVNDLGDHLSAA